MNIIPARGHLQVNKSSGRFMATPQARSESAEALTCSVYRRGATPFRMKPAMYMSGSPSPCIIFGQLRGGPAVIIA